MSYPVHFEGPLRSANGAELSPDGRYRWLLTRRVNSSLGAVTFVMLNPSTADAEKDAPTIRRCIGFARLWDYGCLHVVNLSPLRTTYPRELRVAGPETDQVWDTNVGYILRAAANSDRVVAAWGVHGRLKGRDSRIRSLLRENGHTLYCLGRT